MSINKAQAEALAEGFFDGLGSSKDGLKPKKSLSALYRIAGEFIDEAQQELNRSNSNASGKLSASLKVVNPTKKSIDIEMNFYGQFVNDGVRGTKKGTGKYVFKSPFPGKKMVTAIQAYLKSAKKKTKNVKKAAGKNESKNQKLAEIESAYAVARHIKVYGIKPIGFINKASEKIAKSMDDKLGQALKIDVLNSLPDKLN